MRMRSVFAFLLLIVAPVMAIRAHADSRLAIEYEQIAGSVYTTTVAAASGSDTVAWVTTRRGDVELWVANGPAYLPRKLLQLLGDTGDVIEGLSISPDGNWLTFNRGPSAAPNGHVPNPAGLANGLQNALWVIATRGGEPKKMALGASAATFAPDSARFVFVRENQVLVSKLKVKPHGNAFGQATVLFEEIGGIDSLVWSPSGEALAFISARARHGLAGLFKLSDDRVRYIAPSIDRDVQVSWSLDGRRLAILRLPGTAAGEVANVMTDSNFTILVADAAGSEASEIYRSPGSDAGTETSDSLHWLKDGRVVFISDADGYAHLYAVDPNSRQVAQLTQGRCDEEAIAVNSAGDALAASGNCFDQDRREVALLALDGGAWKRVSANQSIATDPVFIGLGKTLLYRSATFDRAQLPAIGALGHERLLASASQVQPLQLPEIIHLAAPDGTPLTAVWFAPRTAPSGSRAPAVVYVHGGPIRQMMPGWHPNLYYAYVYAANQLLAKNGVGVLAINYRTGVGFGRAFRNAERFGPNGLSELQDVIAAGDKLRSIPGIDAARLGIYGGSYGGHLAANALARRSDLFSVGVAWHGIYDFTQWATNVGHPNRLSTAWGNTETTRDLAYQSSALSQVRTWRSPVLLISGDDDRNVDFAETISLYRALQDAHVPVSAFVLPNEVHSFLRFSSWTQTIDRTANFLLAHLTADAQ